MPIVENVEHRSQIRLGKLTPPARPDQHASDFAVVEGNAPSGWRGVGDYLDGIEFGEHGEYKLQYSEFKDAKGKTNDVHFNGLKLREVIVPRKDAEFRNKYEAKVSRERTAIAEQGANQGAAGITVQSASRTTIVPNAEAPPEPELPTPGSRK